MPPHYHTETLNGYAFRLRYIPETTFTMGSNEKSNVELLREDPPHRVHLSPYYISEFAVTQALWKAVMGKESNPSYFRGENRPVGSVSWDDIVGTKEQRGFLTMLNEMTAATRPTDRHYRLPTEAEWECAAKAGTELTYAGSNKLKEVAWYKKNSNGMTHPVGQKRPNAWGLYDMSGNVREWCMDKLGGDFYEKNAAAAQRNQLDFVSDPYNNSETALNRVLRGGNYFSSPRYCRVSDRYGNHPSYRWRACGFRLVFSFLSLA